MKHRSVVAVIIFSIITFGIYDLFWLAKVKKDLNKQVDVHIPTMWLLFGPILALIVVAFGLGFASAASASRSNTAANFLGFIIVILAMLFVVPASFYWIFKFSKSVSHYTHGELNTAITFILLWLLRFVGMAIIQDKFNDMLASPMQPNAGQSLQLTIPTQPQSAPSQPPQTPPITPPST